MTTSFYAWFLYPGSLYACVCVSVPPLSVHRLFNFCPLEVPTKAFHTSQNLVLTFQDVHPHIASIVINKGKKVVTSHEQVDFHLCSQHRKNPSLNYLFYQIHSLRLMMMKNHPTNITMDKPKWFLCSPTSSDRKLAFMRFSFNTGLAEAEESH